jgi:integrase
MIQLNANDPQKLLPNMLSSNPVWTKTLRRAKIPYFRIYDLRSTYATRLSAGGVADE